MRVVSPEPVRRWNLRVDAATRRSARIERLGLAATTAVAVLGLWLSAHGQLLDARPAAGAPAPINLRAPGDSSDLAPLLTMFDEPAERAAVAEAIHARAGDTESPLEHVGGLAAVTLPAERVQADARLVVLNERLRARGGTAVQALTPGDIGALKSALVVRTPQDYVRRVAIAIAIFLAAFWAAHAARRVLGLTGDPILLPCVHLLTSLGLITMAALRDPLRDTMAAVTMAYGIAAACAVWVAASFVDFESARLRRAVAAPLAAASALALALVVFGSGPAGSGAKVNLLGGQPIEIVRPLFIFSLAAYFARRWQYLRELSDPIGGPARRLHLPRWRDVQPLAISLGTLVLFSVLQRDLGPALVLAFVFLGLFGIAHARGGLVLGGVLTFAAAVTAGYLVGIPSTVVRRISIWLDPWDNALPGGDQVAHGMWAMATGAWAGLGAGAGDPELIPAGHTDLVIASLGEELGFVGVACAVAALGLLTWRMLRTALRAPGDYSAFLVFGLTAALAVQAFVIVGGTLGILPLTGVVTPFLSYGRSAMLSNIAAVAICAAVSRRRGPVRRQFARPAYALGWTLTAAAAIVVGQCVFVQVVHADQVATRPNLTQQADGGVRYQYNPRLVTASAAIRRGTIFDRNGLPLATSRAADVEKFAAEYRRLGLDDAGACAEVIERGRRCYPFGGLAFHLIGDAENQTNWAARNASFVEQDFDAQLKGFDDRPQTISVVHPRSGRTHMVLRRDFSEVLPLVRHRRNPSHPEVQRLLGRDRDVHLTIDGRLQVRVSRAVRNRVKAAGAEAGAAIVLEPATGALLASASYPWPEHWRSMPGRRAASIPETQLLDRARYGLYPPGSTFKLVTAAAALRSESAAAQSTFMCVRLPDGRVGGRVDGVGRAIRDDERDQHPHGRVDLHRALVLSCNPFFAQLAQMVGAQTLEETAAAVQIAAASRPVSERLPRTLPHAGYGQGEVVASPMRMAGVAAAFAAGGLLHPPTIVGASATPPAAPARWVSAASAARMRQYMREAVTSGTGRALARHPVAIAGKTGTAEVDDAGSHAWFVGFAPYAGAKRQIAFAAIVENAGYGGRSAAPLAGDIVSSAQELGLFR